MLNVHTLDWSALALEVSGASRSQLSPLAGPQTTIQGLEPGIAQAMGISPQTRVVLGSSDAASSSYGAGAVNPWQATCMIGTSGALRVISPRPVLDDRARLWCYAVDEKRWLVGGAINNGGIAFSWLKDAVNRAIPGDPGRPGLSFDDLVAQAGQVEAGAEGLVCLPFFAGERSPHWNMNARAVLFGLTLRHDLRHIARALLEGVAFRMRSLNEILGAMHGEIREVRASGGFTHSELWTQIMTDVLNRDLLVPVYGETSSLGAAFWAMLGAGALPTFEAAGGLAPADRRYQPSPAAAAVYDKLYPIYTGLYDSLGESFDKISEFQQEGGA